MLILLICLISLCGYILGFPNMSEHFLRCPTISYDSPNPSAARIVRLEDILRKPTVVRRIKTLSDKNMFGELFRNFIGYVFGFPLQI